MDISDMNSKLACMDACISNSFSSARVRWSKSPDPSSTPTWSNMHPPTTRRRGVSGQSCTNPCKDCVEVNWKSGGTNQTASCVLLWSFVLILGVLCVPWWVLMPWCKNSKTRKYLGLLWTLVWWSNKPCPCQRPQPSNTYESHQIRATAACLHLTIKHFHAGIKNLTVQYVWSLKLSSKDDLELCAFELGNNGAEWAAGAMLKQQIRFWALEPIHKDPRNPPNITGTAHGNAHCAAHICSFCSLYVLTSLGEAALLASWQIHGCSHLNRAPANRAHLTLRSTPRTRRGSNMIMNYEDMTWITVENKGQPLVRWH